MSGAMNKPRFQGRRVKLGEVIKDSTQKNKDGSCTAVYSVTNSRGFVPSEDYFSKEVYSKELRAYRVVERGMIAYNPSRINVGSVALQDCADKVIVSPLYVVFSVDETQLLPGYLVSFLKSKPGLDQVAYRSTGTVRNSLKFDALGCMELKLPPIEVQRRRLGLLSMINGLVSCRCSYLAKLDDLRKSRFIEMFGDGSWPVKRLDEIGVLKSGGTPPRSCQNYFQGDIDWYSAGELNQFWLHGSKEKITEEAIRQSSAKLFPGGSLLIGMYDTAALKMGCIPKPSSSNQACACFTPNIELEMMWLYHELAIRKSELLSLRNGCRQKNLNLGFIKAIEVPVPPLALQQEFSAFVRQVDKLEFRCAGTPGEGDNAVR